MGGGISVVVIVGAFHVDDDFGGFGGFGGPGVASFALHDALAVEQQLRDVGERGGVAPADAAMDQLVQQISQKMIDVGRYSETFYTL
ncbi:MAG TPA: hypothetical protein VE545_07710 [Candidatus Dormibacteraeota bacterium]|nr:hypothetical protein [Candidatus Dormibacteraeota bacterium]